MELTPTETRLLKMLSDGNLHTATQLRTCLNDDKAERVTLHVHLHNLRKKMKPKGEDVVLRMVDGVSCYYLTRRVSIS